MANTLDNVMPKILARGLMVLRKKVIMPRLVNSSYSLEAAKKGDVINIPIAATATASDVTPANTPPTPASKSPTTVAISLDNWKHSDFHLTDKEQAEIDRNEHFWPMQAEAAITSLAEAVNADILAEYAGVYGYVGTAGTTPFGTSGVVTDATNVFKTLNEQKAPKAGRSVVLDFAAEASALGQSAFRDASQAGKSSVIIDGELGRFFGMDWYSDNQTPTHTAGTGSGYLVNNGGGYAAGATTIATDTGSGTILVGDIVTFAGVTGTYVVTAALSGGSFSIYPGLAGAVADNAAITLKASHVVNLAFHREAIGFATRPLSDNDGGDFMSMQDPVSGLVLRVERMRQYKQTVWDFDILWGTKLVRPELACRLAG